MTTIGQRVEHIRKLHPHGPNRFGQLYSNAKNANRRFKKVTLYTIFVSDVDTDTSEQGNDGEQTYLLRSHLFESKKVKRNPKEWSDWFAKNLTEIHRVGVLPGMALRTGKAWSVLKILGWSGDVRTSSRAIKQRKDTHGRRTPRSVRHKPLVASRTARHR